MPIPIPLVIEKINKDINQWYKINVDHFRTQKVSTRYISDRIGETLYQEKKKGNISNYRLMPQSNVITYWMESGPRNRFVFELFLTHKVDGKQSMVDAYDRAMKGI